MFHLKHVGYIIFIVLFEESVNILAINFFFLFTQNLGKALIYFPFACLNSIHYFAFLFYLLLLQIY